MARLFVLLNVEAIGGKTSFLTVLKSSTGSMCGRHFIAASTRECVDDSMPIWMRGRMSGSIVSIQALLNEKIRHTDIL